MKQLRIKDDKLPCNESVFILLTNELAAPEVVCPCDEFLISTDFVVFEPDEEFSDEELV